MLLSQLSPNDPVTAQALRGLMEHCPILSDAQFYSKGGAADHLKKAPTSSDTTTFRALNDDNSPTAGTRSYETAGKKIVSFDAKVDVVLEDRNEDPATELAIQTYIEARNRGFVLQEKFFDGDSGTNSDEFDGMKNIVPSGNVTTPTAGISMPLGNSDTHITDQQTVIETLLKSARKIKGGASHVYMNGTMKIRLLTIAKALGYYRQSKDELGASVDMIANIIVRDAGLKSNGDDILPFNETVGSDTKTSSIYFVRWGERTDLTVLTSKGLVGRYSGQKGNFYINNVNMDAALVLQDDTAIWQHKGWKISSS